MGYTITPKYKITNYYGEGTGTASAGETWIEDDTDPKVSYASSYDYSEDANPKKAK